MRKKNVGRNSVDLMMQPVGNIDGDQGHFKCLIAFAYFLRFSMSHTVNDFMQSTELIQFLPFPFGIC